MIKYLPTSEAKKYLRCPIDTKPLKVTRGYLQCTYCLKKFNIRNNIIEFVNPKNLDAETKRELSGNFYKLNKETIAKYATKDKWSNYHRYCSDKKLDRVIDNLESIPLKGIISLGSGTGFEIKKILDQKKIDLILSSDLSFSATCIVPYTLKDNDITLCLFTSDMNHPPIIPNPKMPVLIYEAMHHTGDIHYTMDQLLSQGYKNILFVEPTTNFIVRYLAKRGLAQRVEYSGGKPDFLDLPTLRKICKKYNYRLKVETVWEFPEDYLNKILKGNPFLEFLFMRFMDVVSYIGNTFKIGSMSIGFMEKVSKVNEEL